ncbi:MAG: tetratricopeptide repeat protein [Myxococcales bacterium]|nr:tetratricopeptide repeat protein [Myxococcales bacterium]
MFAGGSRDKAIKDLLAHLEANPVDIRTRLKLADVYAKRGEPLLAVDQYVEAAQAYGKEGFHLKSIAVYRQALRLAPDDETVVRALIELYRKESLVGEAVEMYHQLAGLYERANLPHPLVSLAEKVKANPGLQRVTVLRLYTAVASAKPDDQRFGELMRLLEDLRGTADLKEVLTLTHLLVGVYPSRVELVEQKAHVLEALGDGEALLSVVAELRAIYGNSRALEQKRELIEAFEQSGHALSRAHKTAGGFDFSEEPGPTPPDRSREEDVASDLASASDADEAASGPIFLDDEMEPEPAPPGPTEASASDFAASAVPGVDPLAEAESMLEADGLTLGYDDVLSGGGDAPSVVVLVDDEGEGEDEDADAVADRPPVAMQSALDDVLESTVSPPKSTDARAASGPRAPRPTPDPVPTILPTKPAGRVAPAHGNLAVRLDPAVEEAPAEPGVAERAPRPKPESRPAAPPAPQPYATEAPHGVRRVTMDAVWPDGHADHELKSPELELAEFEGMLADFKSGVSTQIDASDHESHYNLGIAYREMGLLDDAIDEFKKCVEMSDDGIDALLQIGACLTESFDHAQAVLYYQRALESERSTPAERIGIRYELGLAHEAMGDAGLAYSYFKAVYDEDPNYRLVREKVMEGSG